MPDIDEHLQQFLLALEKGKPLDEGGDIGHGHALKGEVYRTEYEKIHECLGPFRNVRENLGRIKNLQYSTVGGGHMH